jgi:hypothetical protein
MLEEMRGDLKVVKSELTDVRGDISRIEHDVEIKHNQNRKSIHDLRNFMQLLVNKIHKVELKNAGWAVLSGSTVAVAVKLIEHWWKT